MASATMPSCAHNQTGDTMPRIQISACVITLNEADRIDACVESLAFCDEILVVDSGSTDGTVERVAAHGGRVLQRSFDGYRAQKDFAVRSARHDWILFLDADERISAELRSSIQAARDGGFNGVHGYRCARATRYFGAYLRHGNAYPDRVLRLFDRRHGGFRGTREVHEHVDVDGPTALLAGDLLHDAYRSLDDQLARHQRYARMMARHLHAEGRRAQMHQVVLSPAWRFLRGYLMRGGFLDGWRGLFYAWTEAWYVRQKFMRLWLMERNAEE